MGVEGFDWTDPDPDTLNADLAAARDGSVGGLHAKRDEYHADLVMFFLPYVADSCSGLAYLQTTNNYVGWNTWGFASMEACSYGPSVFAHELGHNMGSRHDWYMDNATTPASIAHGYVDTSNLFRTIMSYANRCTALTISCPTIANFSNPLVDYYSAPTGVPSGTSSACSTGDPYPTLECDADNTTNFNSKAGTTAQFRNSLLIWTGDAGTSWTDLGNWEIEEGTPGSTSIANRVPRSFDNVHIPGGLANYPTISTTAEARELVIADGATLNMTGGTLRVGWRWVDSGGFNASGGTLIFSGPIGIRLDSASALPDVQIGDGSDSSVLTLANDVVIDGNLLIGSGATLEAGPHSITLSGDWQEDNVSGFQAGTSTVIGDGSLQSFSKVSSFTLLNEDFSEGDGQPCCSTAYLPPDWTWESTWYAGDPSTGGQALAAGNGWLHSSALGLVSGIGYSLGFDFDQYTGSDTLRVYYGTLPESPSMTNLIGTISGTVAASFDFNVPATDTYYIGFHHDGDNWSFMDNVLLTASAGLEFYNLQVASGMSSFTRDTAITNNLQTDSGAVADFSTYALTVEGTVTNNGSLRQTRTAPDATTTEFLRIQDAAGSSDKYFGVEITPSSGTMGTTAVEVSGNQTCSGSGIPAAGVMRCYTLSPTTAQTAEVTFFYRSAESNGNTAPNVYLDTGGGTWSLQTTSAHGGSGEAVWATGTGITGYGSFALSEGEATIDCQTGPVTLGPATLTGRATYQSETTLTTSGTVAISAGARIGFEAVTGITLVPGFSVANTGVFSANITAVNCAAAL